MVQFYKAPKHSNRQGNAKNKSVKSKGKVDIIQMDTFDHAGNGVCLSSKPITIVERALPNETCEVVISNENKNVRFARIKSVVNANPQRHVPFCEHYEACGACDLQHTNAEYGLSIKNTALQSFLQNKSGIAEACWTSPVLSDYPAYRRRVRLAVDARALKAASASQSKPNAKIGFRSAKSSKVVDIPYCAIARPQINIVIEALHKQLKARQDMLKVGHIVITEGKAFTQLALFLTGDLSKSTIALLQDMAESLQVQVCLFNKVRSQDHHENTSETYDKQIIGPILDELELNVLLSELDICDLMSTNSDNSILDKRCLGKDISLKVEPTHFLQVNAKVNQQMLTLARTWIYTHINEAQALANDEPYSPVLYDFFCGAGNFSLALADLCKQVHAYEGVDAMVKTARLNASYNDVNNCEFTCLDLNNKGDLDAIEFPKDALVVLDPSREGAQNLSEVLANKQLAMIIYVSCNPNSFARDIKHLSGHYQVKEICALDMFPYTKHIELMAQLTPR